MNRRALLLSAGSAALAACVGDGATSAPPADAPDMTDMTAGDDAFGVALYHAVAAGGGNQFVSPLSVAQAFALLYPGARGATAAEIAGALGFDPSPAAQAARSRALVDQITAQSGGSALTIASAAWVERTMGLRPEYARMLADELAATISAVDFIDDPSGALEQINAWAARETRDRIPSILSNPDPDRRLVLTNAVYFKGRWSDPFSASATYEGDFYAASGATQRAQLMRQVTHARYFEGPDFQAADFDYDDGAFALAVFLPRERAGLEALERRLTAAVLSEWLERLTTADRARLDVTLPKVELSAEYELAPHLKALGLRAAFGEEADFSGITGQTSLAVSAVVQKTFLAIDEEGTEAAAVTAIDMVATAAPMEPEAPPIELRADHPFFVVLRHKPTGAPLFYGRIAEV